MDTNYSDSIVRGLIAKILYQKEILDEDYEIIIDTLQRQNDDNIYLIQALKYLNISSEIIDLLITSYECKELFYFLYNQNKTQDKVHPVEDICLPEENKRCFVPITMEEALKKNFANNPNIKLPPTSEFGPLTERFSFFDEETQRYMDCERSYLIDCDGNVVEFHGEKISPSKRFYTDTLYSGVLGEDFFNSKENEQ